MTHSNTFAMVLPRYAAGLLLFALAACATSHPIETRDTDPVQSERPVALVIGNGAYNGDIPPLPNPERDAQAVAERLRSNGFTTVLLLDATHDEMLNTLRTFGGIADRASLALVYYSGHGVEIGERNFLLPVDFHIGTETDADKLETHMVPLAEVDRLVGGHASATVLLLDACRTDPTASSGNNGNSVRSIPPIAGMGRGLAGEKTSLATVVLRDSTGSNRP